MTKTAAMFRYKRYPSRDDFISVARQIIAKYPFLGSTTFGTCMISTGRTPLFLTMMTIFSREKSKKLY